MPMSATLIESDPWSPSWSKRFSNLMSRCEIDRFERCTSCPREKKKDRIRIPGGWGFEEGRKAHSADELGIKATPFDPRETVASDVLEKFTLSTVLGHEVQVRSRLVHVKQFNDVRVWRTQLHQGDLSMNQCRLLTTKKTTRSL